MKKLAIASLLVLSGAAFADVGHMNASGGPAHVVIAGTSSQAATISSSTVSNKATDGDAKATQNVSSNSGNVTVKGGSQVQQTTLQSTTLNNSAKGGYSVATQNVSSNLGVVDINASSTQSTLATNSYITNEARYGHAKAVQNIASNNGCDSCKPAN
jgi:hypothetical protein